MIAVSEYSGSQVAYAPLLEILVIVVRAFGRKPLVERFMDDKQAETVASAEKAFRCQIM